MMINGDQIKRLEMVYDSDPATYSNLLEILKKDAVERNAKSNNSCSKAVLWLARYYFIIIFFQVITRIDRGVKLYKFKIVFALVGMNISMNLIDTSLI